MTHVSIQKDHAYTHNGAEKYVVHVYVCVCLCVMTALSQSLICVLLEARGRCC